MTEVASKVIIKVNCKLKCWNYEFAQLMPATYVFTPTAFFDVTNQRTKSVKHPSLQ